MFPPGKASTPPVRHQAVMVSEVLAHLRPADASAGSPAGSHVVLDCHFGQGGHSRALLEAYPACRVAAIDCDPASEQAARDVQARFPGRFLFRCCRLSTAGGFFLDAARALGATRVSDTGVHGMVFDFGMSSSQLDDPQRGFSFAQDGPLDMRLSREGPTAAMLLNASSESKLADVFYHYGDERRSRAIARLVVAERRRGVPLQTTSQLVGLIRRVRGLRSRDASLRACFQALRIAVNQEYEELRQGLVLAENLLTTGGRAVLIAFHSGEDRLVKDFFYARTGRRPGGPQPPNFQWVVRRPLRPTEAELAQNRRARSARMRVVEKCL